MSAEDPKIEVCARAAHAANRVLRVAQGKPEGPNWRDLEPGEQARWCAWIDQVIHGFVDPVEHERFAAAVAIEASQTLGLVVKRSNHSIDRIIGVVSAKYQLRVAQMIGTGRTKSVSMARHIAMFLAHKDGYSFPEVGRAFGNRNHTTVMAACRKVQAMLDHGSHDFPRLADDYVTLVRALGFEDPAASAPSVEATPSEASQATPSEEPAHAA